MSSVITSVSTRVASRYLSIFGIRVVADCKRFIDETPEENEMPKRRLCTQPFFYTAQNVMGGAEAERKHSGAACMDRDPLDSEL
jgi:hypothetical protein